MSSIEFPTPFKLDRSRHASAQVFEHLRGMIISLAVAPGTVLPRTELAAYFDLSLTPIRDALMRLEEERLVDIFPQHATVVRPIDVVSARQSHFLRQSIELEVVHGLTLDIARHPDLLPRLEEALAQQQAALDAEDYDRFVLADQAFHRVMYEAAKVDSLFDLVRRHSGNLDRLRRLHVPIPGKALSILRDHAEIISAIATGDPLLAQATVRKHLSGTLAHLEDIRARHPEYLIDDTAATA
ncbi:GntR family transcriptional regulator [Herbaspirillum sp. RTI4]|uniref:GntR family transcriptional regulator n=1 Tax=Herbaspirillum sp. RTI4 TaxID=3048640 RepID=UPI002AB45D5D|nr:GntR family transcriptional regulator [Herbaspirillum sp. RTI4]MDY7579402.1 GntR family transcriptional regulator [Herbaspirillum sp. RTI4]MEA9980316.1 GntR family transcriptional regulator [Herbaspirillum sp. RTI4]